VLGSSGKIRMSPSCDYADQSIEVNTDYLRELDGNMKKVPQHFKENLASTRFMPGSSSTVTMGSPAVQASAYDFSSYIVKKSNKNPSASSPKLTVKTYFFPNATTVNGFPVDASSFKFDFVVDNWNWASASNTFQIGMVLTITGASVPEPPMITDPTNGVHQWDFGNFKFSTPTTGGATCAGVSCDAVVSMNVDTTIYCNGVLTPGGCGPGPAGSVTQVFEVDYKFPNFGNELVYDPIISAVPVSSSGGGSSGGTGGTGGTSATGSSGFSNAVSGAVSGMSGIVLAALVVVVMAALAGVGALVHRAVQRTRTRQPDSEAAMMEMVTPAPYVVTRTVGAGQL
jgi:hypothetical protein